MMSFLRINAVYGWTIALALLLDVTGALHVYALGALSGGKLALAGAAALSLLAVARLWLAHRPLEADPADPTLVRGVALLMLAACALSARDFWVFLAPGGLAYPLAFAVGGLALLGAGLLGRPGWLLAIALLLGIGARLAGYALIPIQPVRGDMLPLTLGALENLLRGSSPYTIYQMPWELPLTYLPLTWLAYLPAYTLGIDIRLTNLLADLAVGGALLWLTRRPAALLLWAWVFLLPTSQHWSQSTTAPITWALLAWLLAVALRERGRASAVLLGLLGAASPLASVAGLFLLAHWLRADGWRAAIARAGLAALVAGVFIVPFAAWAPEQFMLGAFRWFNDNNLFPRLRWEMDNTWASQVGWSGAFWRRGLEGLLKPIQLALLTGLLGLYWRGAKTPHTLAAYLSAAYLLFTVFNPVLWPYLYTPALVVALFAAAALPSPHAAEQTAAQPAQARPSTDAVRAIAALLLALPLLIAPAPVRINAEAQFDPDMDARLLANGYAANVIEAHGARGLRASQRSYAGSLWSRDLDYAASGYAFPLADMGVFRDSIELFLLGTDGDGVVPETIYLNRMHAENRRSWDSMPNIIHATYVYVAKTGDRAFYRAHRAKLLQAGGWIAALDTDGDGLPDRDDFPFGYYDSVQNGVRHTYALAKFYAAFRELGELDRFGGYNGRIWDERAARLRAGFHRTASAGGYWLPEQPWPIAWHRPDGSVVDVLETFGVFEALRSGLIAPSDGRRYGRLVGALHERLPELIDGGAPMRLALGGYPAESLRAVDPPVPLWMLDASAPWVVGIAAPSYARAGQPDDALLLLHGYATMARGTNPPVREFTASARARYGPGDSGDGGRAWDSAAWFSAIYEGHYGLTLTPSALVVAPNPLGAIRSDGVQNLSYQGATLQLVLDVHSATYRIRSDAPAAVQLRPIRGAALIQIDGGAPQASATLELEPHHTYVVVSTNQAPPVASPFTAR